jgi:uncharacterized protein
MFALVKRLARPQTKIRHSFQTNGTLITDAWCDLIAKWEVQIGVSVDGPAEIHDRCRRYRNGSGSFAATYRGIQLLKQWRIPFHAISVLTLPSLLNPDKMFAFYKDAEIDNICFNIEEKEGVNIKSELDTPQFDGLYRNFLRRFFDLVTQNDKRMEVREFEQSILAIRGFGTETKNDQVVPFSIISIDADGNLSTFSPELLGMSHPVYGSFSFGNVLEDSFETIVKRIEDSKLYADVRAGVRRCRQECEYYGVCGGGAPANKIYENTSADSTETIYCRAHQIAIELVLEIIEGCSVEAAKEMLKDSSASPAR